ncbi:MAG: hypothetical protein AAF570_03880, partial [Bacteroidota bacterium]
MSFVNKYFNPDIQFQYAEEFVEGKDSHIYSVGHSKSGPVVMKTNSDGDTLWQRVVSGDIRDIRAYNIVQLYVENSYRYVICLRGSNRIDLISVDADGNLNWARQLDTVSIDVKTFLLPHSSPGKGFFLVYSDLIGKLLAPRVVHFNLSGYMVNAVDLSVTGQKHNGIFIDAVDKVGNLMGLAGGMILKESTAVIFELDEDLKLTNSITIPTPQLTLQDILINGNKDYTVSATSFTDSRTILTRIIGTGSPIYYRMGDERYADTRLAKDEKGTYLSINPGENGDIHYFDSKFNPVWSKSLRYDEGLRGAKSIEYQGKTGMLTICDTSSNLLVHTAPDLDTCITEDLQIFLQANKLNVTGLKASVRATKLIHRTPSIRLLEENSEIEDICGGCERNEKVCDLYAAILSLHEDCFTPGPDPRTRDFTPWVNCAQQIMAEINAFNKLCPEMNLAFILKDQIAAINNFIRRPSLSTYTAANEAILFILNYLFELGQCDCGTVVISENASLQSSHLYLQAAGSVGADSTKGVHLRWLLKNALSKHLPKANYATPGINFNKADDFVHLYRAPYNEVKITLDLAATPGLVNDTDRFWAYDVQDEAFYVYFLDDTQYDAVRASINPASNPVGFLTAYGDEGIEIEHKSELSFAVTPHFNVGSGTNAVRMELRSVEDPKNSAPRRVTYRQTAAASSFNGKKLISENIRSMRFEASNAVIQKVDFELYSLFIADASRKGVWQNIGQHALTKDTGLAYSRLEPSPNDVHGNWLRYNDEAYVNINNYKAKWNSTSLDPENRIVNTVDTYITLSDDPTNPEAVELVYFNDPNATPIPGFEPDPDFDPSENQFELSNLYILQLAAMDYHIARMLGLGVPAHHRGFQIEHTQAQHPRNMVIHGGELENVQIGQFELVFRRIE